MKHTQIDTENQLQVLAYELIANTNNSFFLTGRAGTGKTTFLRNIQKMVNKQFITLAPTGVAAILAGGDTIHSFFGLPLEVCTPGTCGKLNGARIQTILHADTIIIDEVSMVRCDIIDAIDYTLRKVLRTTQPFGGKQIVFVGDMFQLPPVVRQ
ncbi:MAG: AAA family ATPase, partial [Paludibacteraceae bacterium]|nr:AAA family ATPase [Paludibacteraceae bacterium]